MQRLASLSQSQHVHGCALLGCFSNCGMSGTFRDSHRTKDVDLLHAGAGTVAEKSEEGEHMAESGSVHRQIG